MVINAPSTERDRSLTLPGSLNLFSGHQPPSYTMLLKLCVAKFITFGDLKVLVRFHR